MVVISGLDVGMGRMGLKPDIFHDGNLAACERAGPADRPEQFGFRARGCKVLVDCRNNIIVGCAKRQHASEQDGRKRQVSDRPRAPSDDCPFYAT